MDRDSIKQKLDAAFTAFKTAIQQQTDINIKRADGGWSVGEIANHIVKGTSTSLGPTIKTERAYDQNAGSIKSLFLNFEMKFPAAAMLQPDDKMYTKGELFSALDNRKDGILKMIDDEDLTETCSAIELPVWGQLTKYEWLVLFENHIIRHTRQVNEFNKITA